MTHPWLDPESVAQGREPMHGLRREPGLLLDGTWRFQLLSRPDEDACPAMARDRRSRLLDDAGHGRSAPLHQRADAIRG